MLFNLKRKKKSSKKKKSKKKNNEIDERWIKKVREWYSNYKKSSYCVVCNETRSSVLESHHVHPEEKSFSISDGVKSGLSIRRLEIEASKCIVVCCFCHRLYHTKSLNISEQEKWDEQINIFEENRMKQLALKSKPCHDMLNYDKIVKKTSRRKTKE
jgi:hypothetical protein